MDGFTPKQRINVIFAKYKYPILVLLVGLGLLLLPDREASPAPMPQETVSEVSLERRLEELLSQVQGAGQVRVLLTEDTGRETVYQTDIQSDSDSHRSEDTVLVEDSSRHETGLVRRTMEPRYRGAVILCQGADIPGVKLAIVEAVRCVTGLGADEISVQKLS